MAVEKEKPLRKILQRKAEGRRQKAEGILSPVL
jgi:hypothetical protein